MSCPCLTGTSGRTWAPAAPRHGLRPGHRGGLRLRDARIHGMHFAMKLPVHIKPFDSAMVCPRRGHNEKWYSRGSAAARWRGRSTRSRERTRSCSSRSSRWRDGRSSAQKRRPRWGTARHSPLGLCLPPHSLYWPTPHRIFHRGLCSALPPLNSACKYNTQCVDSSHLSFLVRCHVASRALPCSHAQGELSFTV